MFGLNYFIRYDRCCGPFKCRRSFSVLAVLRSKSTTREPKPVPGREESVEPLAWAKRLLDLGGLPKSAEGNLPAQLNMICRVKPWKGLPYYEKAMLTRYQLGRDVPLYRWIVVKNCPSTNTDLWKVKHLIRVQPVNLSCDINGNYNPLRAVLRTDGNFILPDITAMADAKKDALAVSNVDDERPKLDKQYLKGWHNKKWARHSLYSDYFHSPYKYHYNQDGEAFRYQKLWRLDRALESSKKNMYYVDGTYARPESRFEANWNPFNWRKN